MTCVIVGDQFSQLLNEHRALRSGTDEAHFTPNHVEELRQFVKPVLSNEPPDACYSRIILLCPLGSFFGLGVDSHGTKLQDIENFATETYTRLTIKHRTLRFQPNGNGDQGHHGRGEHNPE